MMAEKKTEIKSQADSSQSSGFKIKPWMVVTGIIVLVVLFLLLWIVVTYNGLVSSDETVTQKWANVETAYQRRADLIPNLVETVRAYTNYEGDVLTQITEARAKVGQAQTPAQLSAAGQELDSALSRLLVVMENYPNLKANEQYLTLQSQLEGTENRIKVDRDAYNQAIRDYNVRVRKFPSNVIAGTAGFGVKEPFNADSGTEVAPKIKI